MSENMEEEMSSAGENFEKDRLSEPVPVTKKELINLFGSVDFLERLEKASKYTKERNCESSFEVLRDLYNPNEKIFSGVTRGEHTSTYSNEEWDDQTIKFVEQLAYNSNLIRLASFHFHPTIDHSSISMHVGILSEEEVEDLKYIDSDIIVPSLQDLYIAFNDYLSIIGRFSKSEETTNYLLIQQQFKEPLETLPGTVDILNEDLYEAYKKRSQKEVLKVLRENGYKAEIIQIQKDGKLSKDNKEKMEKFTLKPLEMLPRLQRKDIEDL